MFGQCYASSSSLFCLTIIMVLGCDHREVTSEVVADDSPSTNSTAKPEKPRSEKELVGLLDWRTVPRLEGEDVFPPSSLKIGYAPKNKTPEEARAFHRDAIQKAGWQIVKDVAYPDSSGGAIDAVRDGCQVSISCGKDPRSGETHVFAQHDGNVDARTLPRMDNAVPTQSTFNMAIYPVSTTIDKAVAFVREELGKLGWQEVGVYGGKHPSDIEGKVKNLCHVQKGIQVDVTMKIASGGVEITYRTDPLEVELPVMPNILDKSEFMESPPFLKFSVRKSKQDVLAFYKKELSALGWTIGDPQKHPEFDITNYPVTRDGSDPLELVIATTKTNDHSTVILGNKAIAR